PVTAIGNVLIVTDYHGRIAATQGGAFGAGADWLPWVYLGQVSAPPGSPIAAVEWGQTRREVSLFEADSSGAVLTTGLPSLGVADLDYQQVSWSSLPVVSAVPGSPITALSILDHFVVFLTDSHGNIVTTSSR